MNWFIKYFLLRPFENSIQHAREILKGYVGCFVTGFLGAMLAGLFLLIALIFGGIALSIYINALLDSHCLGFLIVAGIYLILMLLTWVLVKTTLNNYMKNKR